MFDVFDLTFIVLSISYYDITSKDLGYNLKKKIMT